MLIMFSMCTTFQLVSHDDLNQKFSTLMKMYFSKRTTATEPKEHTVTSYVNFT